MAASDTQEYHRLRPEERSPASYKVHLPIKTHSVRYTPNTGWSRYKSALQSLLPLASEESWLPVNNVGLISCISLSWLLDIVKKVDETNLPGCSPPDSCDINGQRLQHIWREEGLRSGWQNVPVFSVVWKFVRTRAIIAAVIYILGTTAKIQGLVFCLRNLLRAEDSGEIVAWAAGLVLTELGSALLVAWSDGIACRTAMRIRSASAYLVYSKLVGLSSINAVSTQQMVLLLGSETQKLSDAVIHGTHILTAPAVIILSVASGLGVSSHEESLFYFDISVSVLILLLTYPLLFVLIRLASRLSAHSIATCRKRVTLVQEMLVHIRQVKMVMWENVFSRYLRDMRSAELKFVWKQILCDGISILIMQVTPIMAVLMFLYSRLGQQLHAFEVIPLIALFYGPLKDSLFSFWLGGRKLSEAVASLRQFKSVMLLKDAYRVTEKPINRLMAVSISKANFEWSRGTHQHKIKRKKRLTRQSVEQFELTSAPALVDISFFVPKGKLIGVCGMARSGKTSLLLAILGQLHLASGNMWKDGSCAYVSQNPWVLTASIRDNILFKESFNHKRYYSCVLNCCLNKDIEEFPHHDDSQVDEMSLSLGQKQRIALARALYSNRDIYLLDNPLSMVDAEMAASVFEKGIVKMLKGHTVILVTRNVQFLRQCEEVFLLEAGKIIASGSHEQLLFQCPPYSRLVKMYTCENTAKHCIFRDADEDEHMASFLDQHIKPALHDMLRDDATDEGVRTYLSYIMTGMNTVLNVVALVALLVSTACLFGVPLTILHFQTAWSNMATLMNAGLVLLVLLSGLVWSVTFTKVLVRVLQQSHDSWFEKLCRTPLGYFQAFPAMMCVLNLFSLNIHDLDSILPASLAQMLCNTSYFMCIIFVLVYVSPYCVLVMLVTVMVTLYFLARPHRASFVKMHALEVVTQAPLNLHVVNSIAGRVYIHAFSKGKDFIADFIRRCDDNATCTYLLHAARSWLAVRVRFIAAATIGLVAALVLLTRPILWSEHLSPKWIAGIVVLVALQQGSCLLHILQTSCASETRLNLFAESSQCIQGIRAEHQNVKAEMNFFPANWPTDGSIVFKDVETTVLVGSHQKLHKISFEIVSGQKIGVVGLPGSGKELLVDALFNLVELTCGKVLIGGYDVASVPLNKLRSSVCIVPQNPLLFTGTIRLNLDPHSTYHDGELWESLQQVKLRERIKQLPAGLDSLVDQVPDFLSIQHKQLLCLARACLRDTKVLVVEEPSAKLGGDTESSIHRLACDLFPSATVLTVAHHIKFVMHCDKILVVEKGKVIEFGRPVKLFSNTKSYLSRMLTASTGNLFETEL